MRSILTTDVILELVISSDNPNILVICPELMHELYTIMPQRTIRTLIERDRVDLLTQLSQQYNGIRYGSDEMELTLTHGAINFVLQHTNLLPSPDDSVIYAAESGNLELLKYLEQHHSRRPQHIYDIAIVNAFKAGRLDVIKYFIELGGRITYSVLDFLGRHDDLELLQYTIEALNCPRPIPASSIIELIVNGCYQSVKWLYENRYFPERIAYCIQGWNPYEDCDEYSLSDIAYGAGQKEIAELFAANATDDDSTDFRGMFYSALKAGNVEVIDQLYDEYRHSVEVNPEQFARRGRLDILEVLVKHEWTPTLDAVVLAATMGYDEIVEWLLDVRGNNPHDIPSAITNAISHERISVFRLLSSRLQLEQLLPTLQHVAAHGSLYMLTHLLELYDENIVLVHRDAEGEDGKVYVNVVKLHAVARKSPSNNQPLVEHLNNLCRRFRRNHA